MAATSYTAFLQSMSHLGSVWTSDGGYLQVLGQALKAKSKIKEWAAPATAMQLGTMRAALTRCPMSLLLDIIIYISRTMLLGHDGNTS